MSKLRERLDFSFTLIYERFLIVLFLSLRLILVVRVPEESTKGKLAAFFQLSEIRLYSVLGCIAALVILALLQATCTIMKSSKKSNRHKVSPKMYQTKI